MAVWDLYSKRRKKELGQLPDVFTYDAIPSALRTQVVLMWDEAIGVPLGSRRLNHAETIWETYFQIVQILRREYGVFKLSTSHDPDDKREAREDLVNWFLNEQDIDRVFDGIELTFRLIEKYCGRENYLSVRKNRELRTALLVS
jgi:AbiJ N-terminal domain 4